MAKEFKSGIRKPTDAQIFEATKGTPFKKCPGCGNSIGPSQPWCLECKRLVEIGFGPVPRAGGQGQPEPQTVGGGADGQGHDQDTQEVQSNPAFRHDGYQETNVYGKGGIPKGKIPPSKERV